MEVKMNHERRTMRRGDKYHIEEKVNGDWEIKHEITTIEGAKKILKMLKEQDKEENDKKS